MNKEAIVQLIFSNLNELSSKWYFKHLSSSRFTRFEVSSAKGESLKANMRNKRFFAPRYASKVIDKEVFGIRREKENIHLIFV